MGSGKVSPRFTADKDGTYVARLVVSDGYDTSLPDTVTVEAFSAAAGVAGSTLPDTGLRKCYGNSSQITCPEGTVDTFYGQDAQYMTNPMAFTAMSDGTVIDGVTGLRWIAVDDGKTYNWYEASGAYHPAYNPLRENVCGNLKTGGFDDWRLPERGELFGIMDFSRVWPEPAADTSVFQGTKHGTYWASTQVAGAPDRSWMINFSDGAVSGGSRGGDRSYVRCVRGAAATDAMADNGDGTVTDPAAGLMWLTEEALYKSWEEALSYCVALGETAHKGYTDWRLPDIKELSSLVDTSRYGPAVDTTLFAMGAIYDQGLTRAYWSSTSRHDNAWAVSLYSGEVVTLAKVYGVMPNAENRARCVRSLSTPSQLPAP